MTGNYIWAQTGFNTNASVVVSSLEAIVPTQSGVVYGLELTTGKEIWEFNAGSQIIATPSVDCTTHIIYVATFGGGGGGGGPGGILYAINEPTGRVLWDWSAPTGVGFYASPVVADGRVYVATYSGTTTQYGIYAFNQTSGQLLWGRLLDSPVKSSPAVKDGLVYVATTAMGSTPARLHALNESTGLKIWNYSFGLSNVISSPSVAAGLVLIGCMGGGGGGSGGAGLYAFPESGGTWRWYYPTSSPVSSSPAVDQNKGIVVGCSEGSIFALPLMSIGTITSPIWSSPPEPVKMSSPAISGNGLVYVGTVNNQALCLNETSGGIVWSYTTASPITSSPAITEDHVLIGAGSTLYSFGSTYPNVAVTSVTSSGTTVIAGMTLYIAVNVTNRGDLAQTFNVTLYSGTYWAATAIQTLQVTLAGNSATTLTFRVKLSRGPHVFAAYAWPVRYEANTLDNYCFGSSAVYIVQIIYHLWGYKGAAIPL
jgi:outer membrane protein assembly factor BamB